MNSDAEEIIREYIDAVDKSLDRLPDGGTLVVDWFVFPILKGKYINIAKIIDDNGFVIDYKGKTITILKNSFYSPLFEAVRMLDSDLEKDGNTKKYRVTLSVIVDAKDEEDALGRFYEDISYIYDNGFDGYSDYIMIEEVSDDE